MKKLKLTNDQKSKKTDWQQKGPERKVYGIQKVL